MTASCHFATYNFISGDDDDDDDDNKYNVS